MRDCLTVAIRRTTWKWSPKQKPPWFPTGVLIKAGDNLLSRYSHYHGPQVLNGRVRNGNGCVHMGMVTGKAHVVSRRQRQECSECILGSLRSRHGLMGARRGSMRSSVWLLVPVSYVHCC